MQCKYKWHDDTANTIDWMILSSTLASLQTSTNSKRITQFIHEWFPVNGHAGRANMDNNQLCPMCKTCREIQQHFFLSCQELEETWVNKLTNVSPPTTHREYQPNTINQLLLYGLFSHVEQKIIYYQNTSMNQIISN
jgi:hypothetical protein